MHLYNDQHSLSLWKIDGVIQSRWMQLCFWRLPKTSRAKVNTAVPICIRTIFPHCLFIRRTVSLNNRIVVCYTHIYFIPVSIKILRFTLVLYRIIILLLIFTYNELNGLHHIFEQYSFICDKIYHICKIVLLLLQTFLCTYAILLWWFAIFSRIFRRLPNIFYGLNTKQNLTLLTHTSSHFMPTKHYFHMK